jgi:hypothetical protein
MSQNIYVTVTNRMEKQIKVCKFEELKKQQMGVWMGSDDGRKSFEI